MLAATYLRLNQPEHAVEVLKPALDQKHADPQLLALAAAAHAGGNNLAQAAGLLKEAAVLEPDDLALRVQLGLVLWASGEEQEAETTLAEAVSEGGKDHKATQTLALMHLQRKQYSKALEAIDVLEERRPEDPVSHTLKGAAYLGVNDLVNARKSFERAFELQPNSGPAALNLAQIDLREQKSEAARKRFQDVLAVDENNVQAQLGLAGLAAAEGDDEDYVAWLVKAARVTPPALQPHLLLTRYYIGQGRVQEALAAAQEAQTAFPSHPEALELLGSVQLRTGDVTNARLSLEKAVAAAPNSASAHFLLASAQAKAGQRGASAESLKKALDLNPAYLEAQVALVMLEVESRRYDKALMIARQIETQHPDAPIGMVLQGDIFMAQRQPGTAAEVYELAWRQGPNSALAVKLHRALSISGSGKKADTLLKEWIDANPMDIEARFYWAKFLAERGERQEAIVQYQGILDQSPNHLSTLNNLALLYQEAGDARARSTAEEVHRLAPGNLAVADTLGWVLLQQGEVKRGAELILEASPLAAHSPEIRYHLAVALAKTGYPAKARRELQALLASDVPFGEREAARRLLESL